MAPVTFSLKGDRTIQPYYISPWQGEGLKLDPPVLVPLRGDFFCLPFGANSTPYEGMIFPPHGEPAGALWTLIGSSKDGAVTTLTLSLQTKIPAGKITKIIHLVDGQNVVYSQERLDGTTFKPETDVSQSLWGANDYAAQTYSGIPDSDGRRIQIAWMNGGRYPGMPFNQQMSFPRELTLRTTPEGVRLAMMPVREIEGIRGAKRTCKDTVLKADGSALPLGEGELWDIEAELEPRTAQEVGLRVRGVEIVYDSRTKTLACLGKTARLDPADGRITLRVLVDRTSIEIFAGGGLVTMCSCFLPDFADRSLGIFARGGEAWIAALTLYELESAWK